MENLGASEEEKKSMLGSLFWYSFMKSLPYMNICLFSLKNIYSSVTLPWNEQLITPSGHPWIDQILSTWKSWMSWSGRGLEQPSPLIGCRSSPYKDNSPPKWTSAQSEAINQRRDFPADYHRSPGTMHPRLHPAYCYPPAPSTAAAAAAEHLRLVAGISVGGGSVCGVSSAPSLFTIDSILAPRPAPALAPRTAPPYLPFPAAAPPALHAGAHPTATQEFLGECHT